jgi:hypothetical protein
MPVNLQSLLWRAIIEQLVEALLPILLEHLEARLEKKKRPAVKKK